MDMQGDFTDALKVPAVISTLKKIQHNSDESLRTLHAYYINNQKQAYLHPLMRKEDKAISEVIANIAKQSVDGVLIFGFAHLSYVYGGAFAGQISQLLISANFMTAPNQQFVKPTEWAIHQTIGSSNEWASLGSCDTRRKIGFFIGKFANQTGYHSCCTDIKDQDFPSRPIKCCPQQKHNVKIQFKVPSFDL